MEAMYISLHTTDPKVGGLLGVNSEVSYKNYSRVAFEPEITIRLSANGIPSIRMENATTIKFPECKGKWRGEVNFFGIHFNGESVFIPLDNPRELSKRITPSVISGDLSISLDGKFVDTVVTKFLTKIYRGARDYQLGKYGGECDRKGGAISWTYIFK